MAHVVINYFEAAKYTRDVLCEGRVVYFLFLLENATKQGFVSLVVK